MSELDDAFHAAKTLEPDDRLRLIARLWASLPAEHWAAPSDKELIELQRELGDCDTDALAEVPWKIVRQMAASRSPPPPPAKIYSAPRRFDLATIFAVTSAYSVLFAVMSGLQFAPEESMMVGGFITIVGVGQALLYGGLKPRAASVVTGAATYLLGSIGYWFLEPREFPGEFVVLVAFWCLIVGSILGYLAGVLVGGVFLIADAVRQAFVRRAQRASEEISEGGAN